ncbi:MAG: hypothetical protein NT062_10155, partial [Proteobacteria bacterium]|nr:hypothetical protein [Pseudomonadota bacterium]
MFLRAAGCCVLVACSFHGSGVLVDGGPIGDDGPIDPDSATPADAPVDAPADASIDAAPPPLDVVHVPAGIDAAFAGTASVTIVNATIDTRGAGMMPLSSFTLPTGARLLVTPQDGGGPELAILEVGALAITGTLRVIGTRPLVIVADTTIAVNILDASAVGSTPGGGGAGPRMGAGVGGDGRASGNADSGGGGGGFGTTGGAGQASGGAAAGTAGASYGTATLTVLEGGSGGGTVAPACTGIRAGAGGGAIQLYAGTSITVSGSIRANGGGGDAGV